MSERVFVILYSDYAMQFFSTRQRQQDFAEGTRQFEVEDDNRLSILPEWAAANCPSGFRGIFNETKWKA